MSGREEQSVRYWLTENGEAAVAAIRTQQQDNTNTSQEGS